MADKQPTPKEQAKDASVATNGGAQQAQGTAKDALPSKGQADAAVREAQTNARGAARG